MSVTTPEQLPSTSDAPVYEDYFGFAKTEKWYFPDKVQYIEFEVMNEGKKAKFQRLTQRDLILEKTSGNARMKVDPAQERHELLKESVTGWNVFRGGQAVPFTDRAFKDFLVLADPVLVEDLEKAVRKANPWLMAEMSVEDIDREIENLQEMRKVAEERERGNAS